MMKTGSCLLIQAIFPEERDELGGREVALQPLAADVQGAVLDDCGHFLPEECPDEFVRALTGFWASRR
jgi:pimeloyl-ACP methyl ester carboxylesterase